MGYLVVIFIAVFLFSLLSSGAKNGKDSVNSGRKNLGFLEAKYIVALVAKVAKSDGRVSEVEAAYISQLLSEITRQLGGSSGDREELKRIYEVEKDSNKRALSIAFEYKQRFRLSQNLAMGKVYFLLNVAYIDGSFNRAEKDTISEICDGFEIPNFIKEQIFIRFAREFERDFSQNSRNSYHSQEPKFDPHEILGVDKKASFDEIKRKYRELVRKYHPDILMGKGADDEIVQAGTKKLKEINRAYEEIERLKKG